MKCPNWSLTEIWQADTGFTTGIQFIYYCTLGLYHHVFLCIIHDIQYTIVFGAPISAALTNSVSITITNYIRNRKLIMLQDFLHNFMQKAIGLFIFTVRLMIYENITINIQDNYVTFWQDHFLGWNRKLFPPILIIHFNLIMLWHNVKGY